MATPDEPIEVSASALKNALHEYLNQVSRDRQEVVVTRYGHPIALLTPYDAPGKGASIFGCLAGSAVIHGDIIAPIQKVWEAGD